MCVRALQAANTATVVLPGPRSLWVTVVDTYVCVVHSTPIANWGTHLQLINNGAVLVALKDSLYEALCGQERAVLGCEPCQQQSVLLVTAQQLLALSGCGLK